MLPTAIENAKRRGAELVAAWLYTANAFGSVPHSHIIGVLRLIQMPDQLIEIIRDQYTSATTIGTPEIPILSGVKQGCPLSPILFNLTMEPLLLAALKRADTHGFRMLGEGGDGKLLTILAYADDLVLVSRSTLTMQPMLDLCQDIAEWSGLAFKPSKCDTLHIDLHVRGKQAVLSSSFQLYESDLAVLKEGDDYRHLGVPTGFKIRQTPDEAIQKITDDINKLDWSMFAPWQKIDAAATFIMPRLEFILRGADVQLTPLNNADRTIKRKVKKWLHLPQSASPEVVALVLSQGGAGILPLRLLRYILDVVRVIRMLTCADDFVSYAARESLRAAVRSKLSRPIEPKFLADYLN